MNQFYMIYHVHVGQVFNRLTVVREASKPSYFVCVCSCDGKEKVVYKYALIHGKTQSCGCLRRETMAATATKHGYSFTPVYSVWAGMVQRCRNPKHKTYEAYGGRGITVCDEWEHSPEVFCAWAEAHGYQPGLDLDRKDNSGNYCPENCHFVTKKVNSNNKRSNIRFEIEGNSFTIMEAAQRFAPHLKISNIYGRYYRGWSVERIFELG